MLLNIMYISKIYKIITIYIYTFNDHLYKNCLKGYYNFYINLLYVISIYNSTVLTLNK